MIELLVVIAIIALLIGILLPALGKARQLIHQLRDGTNIRAVAQGCMIWAQNNAEEYPLPSRIDKSNATLAPVPAGSEHKKDLTRHILSLLVFNGNCPTEMLISNAEAGSNVRVYEGYEFDQPTGTVQAAQALWDPKLRGTPLDLPIGNQSASDPANQSYAMNPPFGRRRARWTNSFSSTEVIIGNRGPCFSMSGSGPSAAWGLIPGPFGDASVTLLIHGSRVKWEGQEASNDGHVEFCTRADPENVTFSFSSLPVGQKTAPDNLFINENDLTRAAEGGHQANGSPGLGTYTDSNVGRNSNAYLRPYAEMTGTNADPAIRVWVD